MDEDGNEMPQKAKRLSKRKKQLYQNRIQRYYAAGTSYGHSVACQMYTLATLLRRTDNDHLWWIVFSHCTRVSSLTSPYLCQAIHSRLDIPIHSESHRPGALRHVCCHPRQRSLAAEHRRAAAEPPRADKWIFNADTPSGRPEYTAERRDAVHAVSALESV